jgi:hypothetical protein
MLLRGQADKRAYVPDAGTTFAFGDYLLGTQAKETP